MSEKKTFQQKLEEFRRIITTAYKQTTMAPALCEHIYEDSKDASKMFVKVEQQPTTMGPEDVNVFEVKVTPRDVKLSDARFDLALGDWFTQPQATYIMQGLGREIAEKEYCIIIKGIEGCAETKVTAKQKGKLSVDDILNASTRAQIFADSVVMGIQQMGDLKLNGNISTTFSLLPEEKRGPHYSGTIGASNVFWANFIKDFALVFNRREMNFASTPLQMEFDNIEDPTKLIIRKMCAAAPFVDQTVVKIEL